MTTPEDCTQKLFDSIQDLREENAELKKTIIALKKENSNLKNMEQDYVILKGLQSSTSNEQLPENNASLETLEADVMACFNELKDIYIENKYFAKHYSSQIRDKYLFKDYMDDGEFNKYMNAVKHLHKSSPTDLSNNYLTIISKINHAKMLFLEDVIAYFESKGFLSNDLK